jgi:hypothetical protein
MPLPECWLDQHRLVAGLGGGVQEGGETAAEQVGVAGPACGQVVVVGHGEGWCVVGGGVASSTPPNSPTRPGSAELPSNHGGA